MKVGNVAHQGSVHLLGEGRILVIGTKSRLHMPHGHLVVKGRQCAGKGGRGIAMHQNHIRLALLHHPLHAKERLGGDGGKGLALFHDVEVEVGLELKNLHNRIKHLPVLPCEAANALEIVVLP